MSRPEHYKQVDHILYDWIAPLLDAPFAQDQWSQRYLRSLTPLQDEALILSIFQQPSHDIVSLSRTPSSI